MTELELFAWLKFNYIHDLKKSLYQYESFDCLSEGKRVYIELKCRSRHYDDLIIEKVKFNTIKAKAWEYGYTAWYVVGTPEGIWAFDLSYFTNLNWVSKQLPKTTAFTNNQNIDKTVAYLNIRNGVKL